MTLNASTQTSKSAGRFSRTVQQLVGWPPLDEIDGETKQRVYLVEADWAWAWPGWKHVADKLNAEYGNNRTAKSCRAKYARINAQWVAKQKAS